MPVQIKLSRFLKKLGAILWQPTCMHRGPVGALCTWLDFITNCFIVCDEHWVYVYVYVCQQRAPCEAAAVLLSQLSFLDAVFECHLTN